MTQQNPSPFSSSMSVSNGARASGSEPNMMGFDIIKAAYEFASVTSVAPYTSSRSPYLVGRKIVAPPSCRRLVGGHLRVHIARGPAMTTHIGTRCHYAYGRIDVGEHKDVHTTLSFSLDPQAFLWDTLCCFIRHGFEARILVYRDLP
jgi:hypothetical protein